MIKTKTILKKIDEPNLSLYKGQGYYYFVYDDGITYRDRCVMVNTLNHLSLDSWVYEGKLLVDSIEDPIRF